MIGYNQFVLANCAMPTAINATMTFGMDSRRVDASGSGVIVSGGNVTVSCSDLTLTALTSTATNTCSGMCAHGSSVTLTCTDGVWDKADAWHCKPTAPAAGILNTIIILHPIIISAAINQNFEFPPKHSSQI